MIRENRYEAIITAAGCSRRMGEFKPLLPLGQRTIFEQTVKNFQDAGVKSITAVTGFRRKELREKIDSMGIAEVINPNYETTDMMTSIKLGLRQHGKETTGIFISPADIPLIRPSTIEMVKKVFEQSKKGIVLPQYHGIDGHPPLFSMKVAQRLQMYQGNYGMAGFLKENAAQIQRIEVPDPWILKDADTKEDYKSICSIYHRWNVPDQQLCEDLWNLAGTPEKVRRHCEAVKRMAQELIELLCMSDFSYKDKIDWPLTLAGAMLHDIKRQEPAHAAAGGKFLRELGYEKVAQIVEAHKDLLDDTITEISPELIVYLADRLILHNRRVSAKERYYEKRQRMRENMPGLYTVVQDERRFCRWAEKIKELTGYDLYE